MRFATMPTRDDLHRSASRWSLSLQLASPSVVQKQSFHLAATRIQRHCELGQSNYVIEEVLEREVTVRNKHQSVGWRAAKQFFSEVVGDEDLWSIAKVTELTMVAIPPSEVATDAVAASEGNMRVTDASISPVVEPASSSAARSNAPPLKQRRLRQVPTLHGEGYAPCCLPNELVPKRIRLLQSDRPTAGDRETHSTLSIPRLKRATSCATIVFDSSDDKNDDDKDPWVSLLVDSASGEDPSACAGLPMVAAKQNESDPAAAQDMVAASGESPSPVDRSGWLTPSEIEELLLPTDSIADDDVLAPPRDFWKAVDDKVRQCFSSNCVSGEWFEIADVSFWNRTPGYRFTQACSEAQLFILEKVPFEWTKFKIGITEDPYIRWHNPECGHRRAGWCGMSLLFAASTGKSRINSFDPPALRRAKATSSGAMEIWLIVALSDCEEMMNKRNTGGEGASNECPHFVYVVWR